MIPAITTTHAVPQKLLPVRMHITRARLTVCCHCCQVLGMARTPEESSMLKAQHVCSEKLNDQKPAAALPFS
jgi:hypothetical protein